MAWAALIPLAISAVSAVSGGISKKKAQRERERLANSRPELEDSEFIDEQVALARNELSRGQDTASRVAMEQSMDNDFASSLDAILRGGGSVNNAADLYDRSQMGRMRVAMMDDDLRVQRIRNLMSVGQQGENFRQQQFQFNQFAPWADNTQAAAASYSAANQQMWSGISNAASAASYWAYNNNQPQISQPAQQAQQQTAPPMGGYVRPTYNPTTNKFVW